jgi:lipoprotein-anchoring transpeptidase ErfK/SrfK
MCKRESSMRRWKVVAAFALLATKTLAQESVADASRRIVVSIPDCKLAVLEGDRVVRIFPAAVGRSNSPSPQGRFRIVSQIEDPTWYWKGRIVPPGKANPLGTRWIGLDRKGYGIHGTNQPASIGQKVSHGCIRLRNRDVEELFDMVSIGDRVDLYREGTPELERIFGVRIAQAASGGRGSVER